MISQFWRLEVQAQVVRMFGFFFLFAHCSLLSPLAQAVKNLTGMQKTWVQSLGQEDPLEKGMVTTLVFLPREFHGQRSLADYSPWSHKESDTTE